MVHEVIWTIRAKKDLQLIYEHIKLDSEHYAAVLIQQIMERVEVLSRHPEIGMPVYREKYKDLRRMLFKSYKIIYQFSGTTVNIVTVRHQSRTHMGELGNYQE